jgi:hypothetical protein
MRRCARPAELPLKRLLYLLLGYRNPTPRKSARGHFTIDHYTWSAPLE